MSGATPAGLRKLTVFAPGRSVATIRVVPGRSSDRVAGNATPIATPPLTLIRAVRASGLTYVTDSLIGPDRSAATWVNVRAPSSPTPVTREPPEQRSHGTTWAPPLSVLTAASASYVVVPALALAATATPASTVTRPTPPTTRACLRMVIRIGGMGDIRRRT